MQRNLGRNLILAILFLHFLLLGMTQLIEPLYALDLGVSEVVLGIVSGAFGFAGIFLSISSGALSNHLGQRKVIILSLGFWISVGLLSMAAPPVLWLVAAQVLVGISDLFLWIAAMSYLTSATPLGEHTRIMSMASALMGLGMVVGPALGGYVAQNFGFLLSFISVVLLGLMGLFLAYKLPDVRPSTVKQSKFKHKLIDTHHRAGQILIQNRSVRLAALVWCLGTASWVAVGSSFYLAYLDNLGFSTDLIGLLTTLRGGAITLAQFGFTFLAGNFGVVLTALSGVSLGGLALTLTPFLTKAPVLALIGCIGHGADRLRNPGMFTLIGENVTQDDKPLAYALLNTSWAITLTLLPPLLGWIVEKSKLSVVFFIVGPFVAISSILLLKWYRRDPKKIQPHEILNPIVK